MSYTIRGALNAYIQNLSEHRPTERVNGGGGGGGRDARNTPEPSLVPGLAELVEVLNAMAAAPLGARPRINQDTFKRIENSPLSPVLKGLQPVYKKLGPLEGSPEHLEAQAQAAQRSEANPRAAPPFSAQQPTPAAAPAATGTTSAEAGLNSVSSKLNSVSQAVTDMKQSAKAAIEAVDKKVSQISGELDPALAHLTEEVKRLQVDLVDEFNTERTRLETKIEGLETEVYGLEWEVAELRDEVWDLQEVIGNTKAELVRVEVALEIALEGNFHNEPDEKGGRRGKGKATTNLLQTAEKVRTNTLSLITKCRALFAVINPDLETGANIPNVSMDGEWGRCAEYLRTSNSRLQDAVEEKAQIVQKFQLVGQFIDQMRNGHSALSQLTATQPTAAFDGPPSSTAPANSKPSF